MFRKPSFPRHCFGSSAVEHFLCRYHSSQHHVAIVCISGAFKTVPEFDGTKEHFDIVHPTRGEGDPFKLLGLVFDCKLRMDEAVGAIIQSARPKCKALLRTRAFYNTVDMILQFKTHILGILDSNIGGIYHATTTVLDPLDRIATRFVHELNLEVDFVFCVTI